MANGRLPHGVGGEIVERRERHLAHIGGLSLRFYPHGGDSLTKAPPVRGVKWVGGSADGCAAVRGKLLALALMLIGASPSCGRIAYDPVADAALVSGAGGGPVPSTGNGGAGGGRAPIADAGNDYDADTGPACDPEGFGRPEIVLMLGVLPDLYGPRPSPDGATLFFSQALMPNFKDEDLWSAARTSVNPLRYDKPAKIAVVNSGAEDSSPFVTADGLELYFTSARPGGSGNRDLWLARRGDVTAPWGSPAPLATLDSSDDEQNPSLTGDGLVIFFSSARDGGKTKEDIYTSTRPTRADSFAAPTRVAELSSNDKDGAPFISADGLEIVFNTDRGGGRGGLDLWHARRSSRSAEFEAPRALPILNSNDHEEDPAFSADGREVFFSSNRLANRYVILHARRCN